MSAAICQRRAGAVFAIEASRFVLNDRDRNPLIEFCGVIGKIIIDEDGIYDRVILTIAYCST